MNIEALLNKAEINYDSLSIDQVPAVIERLDIPPEYYHQAFHYIVNRMPHRKDVSATSLLDYYIYEINKYPVLTAEEEKEIFTQFAQKRDEKTRNIIIRSNLRLVINIARRYINRDNQSLLQDLIEEGNIGLILGVEKFDISKNVRFSTYATYWIKHYIQEYLYKNSTALKFSDRLFHKYLKYKKLIRSNENGETMDEETLKKELQLDSYTLSILATLFHKPTFSEEEYNDMINDYSPQSDTVDDAYTQMMKEELVTQLAEAMSMLDEREQEVLAFRYGMYDSSPTPLNEIGEKMHISKQRVSQIEKRALRKLAKLLAMNEEGG